jgi:DNA-binding HxlR family transcriptional regulator
VKKLTYLEKSKAIEILLFVYKNEKKHPGLLDIRIGTSAGSGTIQFRLFELNKIGLIEEKEREGITVKREIKLTEKGRKIAQLLEQVEKILEEE